MSTQVLYPRAPLGVLADGTPVSVRSWLEGSWAHGYQIDGIVVDGDDLLGYRVRRLVDGVVLRAWVSPDDVMPVHRTRGVTRAG